MTMLIKVNDFVNTLAVFVKESCKQLANIIATNALIDCRESNSL
jgi:hypothetical protein